MGGAQPLAATMNGAASRSCVEVDPARIERRLATRLSSTKPPTRSTRRSIALRDGARRATARSIGARGATPPTCCRSSSRAASTPDVLTDQTSAHDPLNGYVPNGLSLARRAALREQRSRTTTSRAAIAGDGARTSRRCSRCSAAARSSFDYGNNIRAQAADGRRRRRVRHSRLRARVHPAALLRRQGPVPLGRALGRSGRHRASPTSGARAVPATTRRWRAGSAWPASASQFQGLPARICWLGYGERARVRADGSTSWCATRRGQGADRDRPRSPRHRLGRLAEPRDRRHERRQRRDRRLADPERAAERRVRRHLGVGPPRRRRRHRLLAARRHGHRRRRHAPRPRRGSSACSRAIPASASRAMPTRAIPRRSPSPPTGMACGCRCAAPSIEARRHDRSPARRSNARVLSALEADAVAHPRARSAAAASGARSCCAPARAARAKAAASTSTSSASATTPERLPRAVVACSRRSRRPTCRRRRPIAARGVRRARSRSSRAPRSRSGGPVDVPARRGAGVPHVRELPGPAPRAARPARRVVDESTNRFVLTTRYMTRALRFFRDAVARASRSIHVPPLDRPTSCAQASRRPPTRLDAADMARAVHALTDGHTGHAQALLTAMAELSRHGGSDPISALAALFGPAAQLAARAGLVLRAAPAPRARLRRAQRHPRHPRRGGAADADRDRAAPAAHARLDEGLPVVARGRGPRERAAEALHVCRPAAAPVGAPALPSRAADRGRHRAAKCTSTRWRACPQSRSPALVRRRMASERRGGSSRSTECRDRPQCIISLRPSPSHDVRARRARSQHLDVTGTGLETDSSTRPVPAIVTESASSRSDLQRQARGFLLRFLLRPPSRIRPASRPATRTST